MNTDDIKDALTVCANNSCSGCLYYEFGNCYDKLKLDARDLMTEQEKEIERLNDDYAKLQELFAQYQMASDKEIRAQVKQAKIDVLNELKAKSYVNDYCREVVEIDKIDELLNEYE